jgi:geranylgeranyl diphosphate synthase type II
MEDLKAYLDARAREVDAALRRHLPAPRKRPATIHAAMRHSLFAGGKRLRPVLCLAAAETCGGETANAMPAACAVELMHTYSLVHDDLPCMDDDDLRRGRPTCHKVYGEGMAVLTGDALLTQAFEVLAATPPTRRHPLADFVRELAVTGGSTQLIGGQVMDLEGEGRPLSKAELVRIHQAKTAALLTTSLRLGAMSANAPEARLDALTTFGRSLGLAFQVIDDILDVTQTTDKLGKTAGKDQSVDKATYPSLLGLDRARAEAGRLTTRAMNALDSIGRPAARLRQIAAYLLDRDY